jgi:hypothetical protein
MIAGADQVMFSVKNSGKNRLQQEVQGSSGQNAVTPLGRHSKDHNPAQ